jgi:hypothetical protein
VFLQVLDSPVTYVMLVYCERLCLFVFTHPCLFSLSQEDRPER